MAGPARSRASNDLRARIGKHAADYINKFCRMDERTVTASSGRRGGPATAFALFDTALGVCGIAWNDGGVVGVHLPARDAAATRLRLEQKFRDARESEPSVEVARTIERIVALLRGKRVDLSAVPLDMSGIDKFDREVYVAAREIPAGDTRTYGEIAKRLGRPEAARDVGVRVAQIDDFCRRTHV